MTYKYKQTWFLYSEISKLLMNYCQSYNTNTILEIGCFEGLSSVFFADNLLNNLNSTLTCVDPFMTIDNNDHQDVGLDYNTESNFDYNIKVCKNSNKIQVHKITSDEFFKTNTKTYNIIYIDGCHECDYIKRDMINSFRFLKPNGIMWMDDYLGGDSIKIKNTMDQFLFEYQGQYKIIHSGYQLAIQKK
jgi:predicted O-methyltransferase YrrM